MRDLFYYKREIVANGKKYTFLDSFNVNKVVRTVHQPDGTSVVLLDDGHEESTTKQVRNLKGKTEEKREREYYFSQITISSEDRVRLQKATAIDEFIED